MSFESWLAFTAASIILLAIPGPTILLVISYAMAHGRRPAAAITAGVALGDLTAMTASMLGLGAIIATSATLFTALRWLGGAYLIYMGVKLWRAPVAASIDTEVPATGLLKIFGHSYIVTALNPKSIVFFVAFVPQFLSPDRSFLSQVFTMEATFVVLAALNAGLYALMAASLRQRLHSVSLRRAINRTGGALLTAAGCASFALRRAS